MEKMNRVVLDSRTRVERLRVNRTSTDEYWRANAPDVMSLEETARYLGVSEPLVLAAVREQGLPCRMIGERTRLFSRRAILTWIENTD